MGCCTSTPSAFDALRDQPTPTDSELKQSPEVSPRQRSGFEMVAPVRPVAPRRPASPVQSDVPNQGDSDLALDGPVQEMAPAPSAQAPAPESAWPVRSDVPNQDDYGSALDGPVQETAPAPSAPAPAPEPPAVPRPAPAIAPAPASAAASASINPKYMTLGQLKKAIREHGAEPVVGGKEALQAQLSDILGQDSSLFKAASAEQEHRVADQAATMAARRAAVEAALNAGPPKRLKPQSAAPADAGYVSTPAAPSMGTPLGLAPATRVAEDDVMQEGVGGLAAVGSNSSLGAIATVDRPRAASSRRPPSRKPLHVANREAD